MFRQICCCHLLQTRLFNISRLIYWQDTNGGPTRALNRPLVENALKSQCQQCSAFVRVAKFSSCSHLEKQKKAQNMEGLSNHDPMRSEAVKVWEMYFLPHWHLHCELPKNTDSSRWLNSLAHLARPAWEGQVERFRSWMPKQQCSAESLVWFQPALHLAEAVVAVTVPINVLPLSLSQNEVTSHSVFST